MKNRMSFVSGALAFFISVNCSPSTADAPPSPIVWRFGDHVVKVYHGALTLYAIKDSVAGDLLEPEQANACGFLVVEDGEQAISNKFVRINGGAGTVMFRSDSGSVLAAHGDGSLGILGPGSCNVSVSLGSKVAVLHFNVVILPLATEMSEEDVVAVLGLPDKRKERTLPWTAKAANFDGVWYVNDSPDDQNSDDIEHWFYSARPSLIVSFENRVLTGCIESSWDAVSMAGRACVSRSAAIAQLNKYSEMNGQLETGLKQLNMEQQQQLLNNPSPGTSTTGSITLDPQTGAQ